MKWSFVIQQKMKAALLLGGIMVLIILGTLLSRHNMEGVNRSFSSIYQDRLIPATTIIYLTENLYGKRLLLEKYLFTQESQSDAAVKAALNNHNKSIDSLIRLFEKTYLVDQEAKSLEIFKMQLSDYRILEDRILALSRSGATVESKSLFAGNGAGTFQGAITNLNELAGIQSDIGKNLMKESRSNIASSSIISFLQIALAVIIGLMIMVLIRNSQIISKPKISGEKSQYFNLN
jgi:preprotein translocase subunit SecG